MLTRNTMLRYKLYRWLIDLPDKLFIKQLFNKTFLSSVCFEQFWHSWNTVLPFNNSSWKYSASYYPLSSIKWGHQSWHQSKCGITCEIKASIKLEIIFFSPAPECRLLWKMSITCGPRNTTTIKTDVFVILWPFWWLRPSSKRCHLRPILKFRFTTSYLHTE